MAAIGMTLALLRPILKNCMKGENTMRSIFVGLWLMVIAVLTTPGRAHGQAQFGIDIRDGQLQNFYFAIGDYYGVPRQQITMVQEYGIPQDEIPVVFFISQHSGYEPLTIVRMRRQGKSWMDISTGCGIQPDVYYVPETADAGPPYGNAYGYYKHHGNKRANRYYLSDNDLINSVNVHFIASRYGCNERDVYTLRSRGDSFESINNNFQSRHGGHGYESHKHGRGQGHGHGKHRGWGDNN